MYTWGYIKDAALAKLDLSTEEANTQGLLRRFYIYANEVITQVSSTVKPKRIFAEFEISKDDVGVKQTMPNNFISFNSGVCYELIPKKRYNEFTNNMEDLLVSKELHDTDIEYQGYNNIVFKHPGKFYISYNARWFTFDVSIDDNNKLNEPLDIPDDIADCIPSYIASQCYKIDDEYKASVFRNEYEIMLARINDYNYNNTTTIEIKGDW